MQSFKCITNIFARDLGSLNVIEQDFVTALCSFRIGKYKNGLHTDVRRVFSCFSGIVSPLRFDLAPAVNTCSLYCIQTNDPVMIICGPFWCVLIEAVSVSCISKTIHP